LTIKRFGVSVPGDLLSRFDRIVAEKGYVGRSEAIRDAMRAYISQCDWESDQKGNRATLSVVYQHKPSLMAQLVSAQHEAPAHVISTVHVHLTHSHCLEVMALQGSKAEIQNLADKISGFSGVEFVRLFVFSLAEEDGDHHHRCDFDATHDAVDPRK
jgi:CopG family transcriptional regulator, nickel-responsive regulator